MIPGHLAVEVEEVDRDGPDDNIDRYVALLADLVVADAVPERWGRRVQVAIERGWLSPSGDILRDAAYADERDIDDLLDVD